MRFRRVRLGIGLAAVALGAALLWMRESPSSLLRSARETAARDVEAAERLAERAVVKAGGSYPEAELFRCVLFARLKRWDEALGGFSLIVRPESCDAEALVELAERASQARQPALAARAASAARGQDRLTRDAALLGRLLEIDRWTAPDDVVERECRLLEQIAPDDWRPGAVRARRLLRVGQVADSAAALDEALRRRPPDESARTLRLELVDRRLDLGERDAAREAREPLLEREDDREILLRRAILQRLDGAADDALASVDQALALGSDWPAARFQRGALRLDAGEIDGAIDDFEAVVRQEPFRKEAHYKLGMALRRAGREADADERLARARRLTAWTEEILEKESAMAENPNQPDTLRDLAALYAKIGRFDEATRCRQLAEALSKRKTEE